MDIVERLRKRAATWVSVGWGNNDIFDEAADEIERLRKEVDELKDLMQATVNYTGASVSSTNYTFHVALEESE